MKRQRAFIDREKGFMKGGLHTHTTRSDGVGSPEDVMRCLQAAVEKMLFVQLPRGIFARRCMAPYTRTRSLLKGEMEKDLRRLPLLITKKQLVHYVRLDIL